MKEKTPAVQIRQWAKKDAPTVVITLSVAGEVQNKWVSLTWSQKELDKAKDQIDKAILASALWKE